MNENLFNQGLISKDMLHTVFLENKVSVMTAHINSENLSIAITSSLIFIGFLIVYKTIKNLRILKKHYKQASRSEFDGENNKTSTTTQMEAVLLGDKRTPFRRWITEPPSLTILTKIQTKRKYKAALNFLILLFGLYLIVSPFSVFFEDKPYKVEINKNAIILDKVVHNNIVIQKKDIELIKIEKDFIKSEQEYFYPRCKITVLTNSENYEFYIKQYNMETLRLKDCK